MMKDESTNTEAIILEAARHVFIKSGLDGARMQEIADKAGINKALLHYYYRSKEKLFERIFAESFKQMFEGVRACFATESSLETIIRTFIPLYLKTIQENPFLPSFVMHEINNRPERLKEFMLKGGVQPNYIIKTIEDAKKQGLIHPLTGGELMMSMIGICVIPVIGRPIFKTFFYNNCDEEYDDFLKNREKKVIQFIFNAIYINPPKA